MDPSTSVVGLDAQGNVLFRVMKPVLGLFQVSSEQANSGVAIQGLSDTSLVLTQGPGHALLAHSEGMMDAPQPQILQVQAHAATPTLDPAPQSEEPPPCQISNSNPSDVTRMPFAEVSSLLDPNMKGSKARKCLISYEEIKRRLQSPEKMSLRSLAAYTRVSRGPASKKTLLESLHILGLTPGTTTAVSSSFSKLTEGDTNTLCADMKDFALDYVDYGHMAKQLIPETNTVQHWSKIIETNEGFDSVTHGLGLGMLDVALDMVSVAIDQQIRILSGAAASDPPDLGPAARRRRNRKPRAGDKPSRVPGGVKGHVKVMSKGKGRGRARGPPKAPRPADPPAMEAMETVEASEQQDQQNGVLTLVSVGYETTS
ncbi:hypothetical protein NHX12_025263 [Muraenolepis orangiensis]|uniref:Transcription factor AP-2 C-terminal domain-containing protein n=1 Tax=Muraenolepis orangiensis TaxID=630683 RepID=A0A9Q0EKV8_9TELE|nr:hypothetical protein NHX12_025263 [Muraenolepis orangiensis]